MPLHNKQKIAIGLELMAFGLSSIFGIDDIDTVAGLHFADQFIGLKSGRTLLAE
ncbi:hypothetical protein TRIP_C20663 [Candidatus Zixiibacteriota bacterium]|nr:hypothetical protein TRIP_C20663 [candidate division Zixibacteria bacterium]